MHTQQKNVILQSWARAELAEDKSPSFGQREDEPSTITLTQDVAVVEEFAYFGSLNTQQVNNSKLD